MSRADRLYEITRILHDGRLHRAQDLALAVNVSQRTIYRDMDTLVASGLPVGGTRGTGYRITADIMLPPLNLSSAELEALNLGIAIVTEASDPDLRAAANTLAAKVDAVLPAKSVAPADAWKFAATRFADAKRGFAHLPVLRAALAARQKLDLHYQTNTGTRTRRTVRPLHLEHWGRIWTLTAWCELRNDFRVFRVDLMVQVTPLPALFVDEPGKRLQDFQPD